MRGFLFMKYMALIILLIYSSFAIGQTDREKLIEELDCNILKVQVLSKGSQVGHLDAKELNSSFLKNIFVFVYEFKAYVFVDMGDEYPVYMYCNIPDSDWKAFFDPNDLNFGRKFNKYIRPHNCGC